MTRAENLANELYAEMGVVTAERDDLKLRLDEAEAVIDAVRKVREIIRLALGMLNPEWKSHMAVAAVLRRLNKVDGL